tara:strand:- start:91 stop:717 length:627 start_codon:yes stop_codon:yes gene_type:complete
MVIWLVGMSGVGKSTIADKILQHISDEGNVNIVPLDGDIVRLIDGNNKKTTSYSIEARFENAKRIQEISLALDKSGENVICSILCIFPDILKENKEIFSDYYEVFLNASMEELERRDTKGLYAMAKNGQISNVVGYDIDFPIPGNPNLILRTDDEKTANELARIIFEKIRNNLIKNDTCSDLANRLSETNDTVTYAKIISEKIKPYTK